MHTLTKNLLKHLCIISFMFLCNCSSDEGSEEINLPDPPTGSETPTDDVPDTSLTDETDQELFKQIKGHADFYKKGTCFEDFVFGEYPLYLVQVEGSVFNGTNLKALKGYVLNPSTVTSEMKKLGSNESYGLNVYRFDPPMQDALNELKGGNGVFSFNYEINGDNIYYLQIYNKENTAGFNKTNSISTITHEAFHDMHQTRGPQNPDWSFSRGWIQDTENFPFTRELVELQILVSEIFIDYPNITDQELISKKLKQYLAIRSKEMEIDPSSRELIKNMALQQERIEGGAYYAEMCGKRDYFKEDYKFFGFVYGIPLEAKSRDELKGMLNFGNFYSVGASVLYSLTMLDKERVKQYDSKTPFQMASELFPLTAQEKAAALEEAKASVNWQAIQDKAAEFTAPSL